MDSNTLLSQLLSSGESWSRGIKVLKKIIKTLKLLNPICLHEWERDESLPIITECKKCHKQMFGNTVIKHGDWITKR